MMGAASSAFALQMTFNLNRIPDSYSKLQNGTYYDPKYKLGKGVLSGYDVRYMNDRRYVPVENGGHITISNIPFIINYYVTYQVYNSSLTKTRLREFELILTNNNPATGSYSPISINSVRVIYGVNFDWEDFQYTLLTDETAQVERCADSSEIVVPSTLPFAEKGWYDVAVTKVYDKAFANLSNLTKITLPATIKSIGSHIFYNSPNIATVIVEATTPPTLSADAFGANDVQNIAVYVPAESYSEYKSAPVWKDMHIVPSSDVVSVDGIEYIVTGDMAFATAFDRDAETVSVPSTISVDGKDYAVTIELLPTKSYSKLKSVYIGDNVAIQSLSYKIVPNLRKLFYLGTSAPSVTTGAMTSLSGRDV